MRLEEIRNPGFLLTIIGWGALGIAGLQVSIAIFSGTVEIFLRMKMAHPLEKIGPYTQAGTLHGVSLQADSS